MLYAYPFIPQVNHHLSKNFARVIAGKGSAKQRKYWLRWAARNFDHPAHSAFFSEIGIIYPEASAVVPQQHLLAATSDELRHRNQRRHSHYRRKALVSEDFDGQGDRLIKNFHPQFQKALALHGKGIPPYELAAFQHRAELRILNRAREASAPQATKIQQAKARLSRTLCLTMQTCWPCLLVIRDQTRDVPSSFA